MHWPVAHGRLADNRRELLRLNRRAAELGARVIVNTEMALSGYGFDSREEIAPLTETADGPTVEALADLAREHGLYLALGLAERDPLTDAFHNCALLLGPDGRVQARRRKVTAEAKWACPGPAVQDDCCDTPFGRLGLLICSETYFSLLPRLMALKGVDLLLVPANWPPGAMDPARIWRCRALENRIHLAACNRSGQDRRMDCDQARSHLFDPQGCDRLTPQPAEPGIFMARLPLEDGRLPGQQRRRRLAGRQPGRYHYIASQLNRIQDLTGFLGLPGPGRLAVHCLTGLGEGPLELECLVRRMPAQADQDRRLALLPGSLPTTTDLEGLARLAATTGVDLLFRVLTPDQGSALVHCAPDAAAPVRLSANGDQAGKPPYLDLGPARVGLATAEDLMHPELALALAKRGCDLVAVNSPRLGETQLDLLALRSLERVAVAVASPGAALISGLPQGHSLGALEWAGWGQSCAMSLDTGQTRSKVYEELIDFPALLGPPAGEAEA
ncbi:MAG: nitrilase-related carbon-nitrogen hydrolase [Pseudomonadota bacterium]